MRRRNRDIKPLEADFFEKYPLYRKFRCELPGSGRMLDKEELYPPIKMSCEECRSTQTFRVAERFLDGEQLRQQELRHQERTVEYQQGRLEEVISPIALPNSCVMVVNYKCSACDRFYYKFMFKVDEDGKSIHKAGQSPPWSILVEEAVKNALGRHVKDYQRGLVCESQGYGIGAFAYYRRIVELVIADLLQDIEELIPDSAEKHKYHNALSNIQGSQSAAVRIEVVKELLPASLRPRNVNPLDILYSALSGGLHDSSDEDCLDIANAVRTTLVYLIGEVAERKRNAREYESKIESVMEKIHKKGQKKTDVK